MIDLAKKAKKFLDKVKPKEKRQLWDRIQELQNAPRPHDSVHMTGYPDCFRIDVGEFRVIYNFDPPKRSPNRHRAPATGAPANPEPTTIKVVVVARKNDSAAYKQLKRSLGRA